jgi:hypothetical protein
MSDYDEVTDCPICPQLATDRDDALGELGAMEAIVEDLKTRLEKAELLLSTFSESELSDARAEIDRWRTIRRSPGGES